MGIREKLQKFDTHSAVSKEFRVYSVQGAAISVLTVSGKYTILKSFTLVLIYECSLFLLLTFYIV